MRKITTYAYSFDELSKESKKTAIRLLRQECFEQNSERDWYEANETSKFVEYVAHVFVSVQQSSQGFYVESARDIHPDYDKSDLEDFIDFRNDYLKQYKENIWSDPVMKDIIERWSFNEHLSYASNIGGIFVRFCNVIYDQTMCYFDDERVEEFIHINDFEFLKDGRVYHG